MFLLAVAQTLATSAAHHVATPMPVNPVLHSPLPVNVKDWPGPDEVARKTLEVANRTLLASIIAIFVGVVAIGVAVVDAWNNRRQLNLLLRQPDLSVHVNIIEAVFHSNGDRYYEIQARFRVTNLERATSPADNVTVRLHFPENIRPTDKWKRENERTMQRYMAGGIYVGGPMFQPPPNPRKFISNERLSNAVVKDGHKSVTFYDENGMQLLPGTGSSVSDVLILHVPEKARDLEWKALSVQGTFPKNGRGKISLVSAAKEKLTASSSTSQRSP